MTQQVDAQYEPGGFGEPVHSYPPSFFTFAVPPPRQNVGPASQALDGAVRHHGRPNASLPALVQATAEVPKSAVPPCVAYSNASQAIVSAEADVNTSRHVDQALPVRQPKHPARQAPVPWPKVQGSSPKDQAGSASERSHVEQQPQAQQPDIALERDHPREAKRLLPLPAQDLLGLATSAKSSLGAGHKSNGQSDAHGRADARLPRPVPSSPPQPVWDKDDELSGHRKAERIKRRKIEQWAREVRQQAQREHLAADCSETSIKSIVTRKRSHHELDEAEESKLPASTTPTFGPSFGATFGDLYGGRGNLFADVAVLGPAGSQADGMTDCLYLNPFYGLVDSTQLSKEALEAQNALYAYRQRKERDHRSAKLKDHIPSELTTPQSVDSRPSSGFATRKRTDQVRLDPSEIHVVRQRSALPVVTSPEDVQEIRQERSPDRWSRPLVDKAATAFAPKLEPPTHKYHTDILATSGPLDEASDNFAGSWELPRPFDYRRAVKRHVVLDHVSLTLPPPASAQILTSDETLQFLEEGRAGAGTGAEDAGSQDLSIEEAVAKPSGVQQAERITSLGNSTITASHPSHFLAPRHIDPTSPSGSRLAPAYYLDQQQPCAQEKSIEMFYNESEKPQTSDNPTTVEGGRVRRHAAEVMLASGDVSLHVTPAEDMEVDVSSEHHSNRGREHVSHTSWHQYNGSCQNQEGKHSQSNKRTLDTGPKLDVASPDRSESAASSPQNRSGFSHAVGSTPAVSIRPPPEDSINPEDRYRPRPPPRESRDITIEPSPDPSMSLPGQRSFSGSGDTFSSIEPGDHTYTKLWQAIQTMIASSGQGSRTSLLSTSSGLHSAQQQSGTQSLPREGGAKLGVAKASVCTEDIPALELDGGAGQEISHALTGIGTGAPQVQQSTTRVEVISPTRGGPYEPAHGHRLLSPQTSAGRLNMLASQGTLERCIREKEKNIGGAGSLASPKQALPIFSLSSSMREDDISHSGPMFPASSRFAKQGTSESEQNENVRIAASGEHHLLVPIDCFPDVPTHAHAQAHQFPRLPHRPSLRKVASRQCLRVMKSDVSMRTAGSLSQSQAGSASAAPLDDAGDLSGILEEAKSDVAMRTASGYSSSHGHGGEGAATGVGSGVGGGREPERESLLDAQTGTASNEPHSALAAQAEQEDLMQQQQRALIYGKRRRRESGRLL